MVAREHLYNQKSEPHRSPTHKTWVSITSYLQPAMLPGVTELLLLYLFLKSYCLTANLFKSPSQ